MKKRNKKWPLVLILFASMFNIGLTNQSSYVTKAVEVGNYQISTNGAEGALTALNSVEKFEAAYATPEGISWAED